MRVSRAGGPGGPMIALDALLALGVVLNAIKAAHLVLGARRVEQVHGLMERCAHKLRSARPIEHLARLASERGQRRLLLIGLGEFFLAAIVDVVVDSWDGELDGFGGWGVLLMSGAVISTLPVLCFLRPLGVSALMRWLVEDTAVWPFVRRFARFFLVGLLVIGAYQGTLWAAARLAGVDDPYDTSLAIADVTRPTALLGIAALLSAPAVIYYCVVIQLGWMALVAQGLAIVGARLVDGVRSTVRAIDRRVSGTAAAAVLAATIVLALARLVPWWR